MMLNCNERKFWSFWHLAIFPWGIPHSILTAAVFHYSVRDRMSVVPLCLGHQNDLNDLRRRDLRRKSSVWLGANNGSSVSAC